MKPKMGKAKKEIQEQGQPDCLFRGKQESEDEDLLLENGDPLLEDRNLLLEEDLFSVEGIVGSKEVEGRIFYRIKWEGYDKSQNTWEPIENLTGSIKLLEQFWSQSIIRCRGQCNRPSKSKRKSKQLPPQRMATKIDKKFKLEQKSSSQNKKRMRVQNKETILIEQLPQQKFRKVSESDQDCRIPQMKVAETCSHFKNELFSLKIEGINRKMKVIQDLSHS